MGTAVRVIICKEEWICRRAKRNDDVRNVTSVDSVSVLAISEIHVDFHVTYTQCSAKPLLVEMLKAMRESIDLPFL